MSYIYKDIIQDSDTVIRKKKCQCRTAFKRRGQTAFDGYVAICT
ncbi:hypothetical protein [Amedibacillus dolichus]